MMAISAVGSPRVCARGDRPSRFPSTCAASKPRVGPSRSSKVSAARRSLPPEWPIQSSQEAGPLAYVPGPLSAVEHPMELALIGPARRGDAAEAAAGAVSGAACVSRRHARRALSDDGKDAFVAIYNLSGANLMRRVTFGGKDRFPAGPPTESG